MVLNIYEPTTAVVKMASGVSRLHNSDQTLLIRTTRKAGQ